MDLTSKQFRALRDMADGHLTLYASVEYFDGHTGEQLPEPRLQYVGHDRPDMFDMDWWKPLLEAGLIALPAPGCGNRCTVTLDGHKALAAHRRTRSDPPMRIDIPTPVTLNATIGRLNADDRVFAVLQFGNTEITRWDVTSRRTEFEPQPGDYWSVEDCERHEQEWLSEYVARQLAPMFTGEEVEI